MHLYWNSVLQSAELDSAADFRAAASTGKQGFGDGRTAGKPHGSETNLYPVYTEYGTHGAVAEADGAVTPY